jgi:LuxR family maltose regulon positive regulatory protein
MGWLGPVHQGVEMTQLLAVPTFADSDPPPPVVNLPHIPTWVIPRLNLVDRLNVGVSGLLTVVSGPTGAGKTTGVASWATGTDVSGGVIWLNLSRGGDDPDVVWRDLRSELVEAGVGNLPPLPSADCGQRQRIGMLADLGFALRTARPRVVVLDDYPTGPSGRLARELEIVLGHARRGLRLVVLCQGEPAIDAHRHWVAGELTKVTPPELVMDAAEVAEVLRRHDVNAGSRTVEIVQRHTSGWACGVRHAAKSLQDEPTMAAAMVETDLAIADYLAREVLAKVPPAVRDLLVRTSIVEEVTPDLARVILGRDVEPGRIFWQVSNAFIELRQDGSFRCHRLLRAAALGCLSLQHPDFARDARRRAARWYVESGDETAAIRLAIAAGEWSWVARALVDSHAVPRILAGTADEMVESAARVAAVGEAEPVLAAAVALANHQADAAEAALDRAIALPAEPTRNCLGDRLGVAFAQLAFARLRGDTSTGMQLAKRTRELIGRLPVTSQDDVRDFTCLLDAQVGALEAWSGDLHAAALTLARGVAHTAGATSRLARADCEGQLALVEAIRGNLGRATRCASSVLAGADGGPQAGVVPARLGKAWVHLERGELDDAREGLDRTAALPGDQLEPWIVLAQLLAEARLLTASGQPAAALRLLAPSANPADRSAWSGGLPEMLAIVSAEALLADGEPQRALAQLTPLRGHVAVEAGVLAATARREIGDLRGARAALAKVADDLPRAQLAFQVQSWLLGARLAHHEGDIERSRVLVDRALRTAAQEGLRRPFAPAWAWLRGFLHRDTRLRRDHRAFLDSLASMGPPQQHPRPQPAASGGSIVEPLSEREVQVLELLAQMYSTNEIAGELYVSVNTVKTHLKGIFRKLGVNRRVDAVRMGRELGFC